SAVNVPAAVNETFNVGADVPYTVNKLARTIAVAMDAELSVEHLPPRNEVKIGFSDHSKAERVFGHRNKLPLEEGIRRMAECVKTHGARESSVFDNIEIHENLPPSWAAARRKKH